MTVHNARGVDVGLRVGSRVGTRQASADGDGWTDQWGVIVEDFAPNPGDVAREWAVARRWGVALDNGCLVFRDSEDVWLP